MVYFRESRFPLSLTGHFHRDFLSEEECRKPQRAIVFEVFEVLLPEKF